MNSIAMLLYYYFFIGLAVYTWLAIYSMYIYMKEGETQSLISPGRVLGY
jgi:hypothetical protein